MRSATRHPRRAQVPTSPIAVRAGWREFIATTRSRTAAAAAGRPHDRVEEVEFAQHVLLTGRALFPVEDAPARGAAAAFVKLAQTFLETTGAKRRAQLAAPLERLAELLDEMIEEQGLAAAERGRMIIGERD